MCIAIFSTAHPDYSLIIIDNRDEFLRRPTSTAEWWPSPHSDVLGSRDLARAVQGTWMGVTKHGKIAVLTNYREKHSDQASGLHSRGAIVNSWLAPATTTTGSGVDDDRHHHHHDSLNSLTTREFARKMISSNAVKSVGGFSLVCGYVNEPLAVISNRSLDVEGIKWICVASSGGQEQQQQQQQTIGLSNTAFDDRSWPKIIDGEKLMEQAIREHVMDTSSSARGTTTTTTAEKEDEKKKKKEDEDDLIRRLLQVLSTDTLPRIPSKNDGTPPADMEAYLPLLRQSIFIPVIGQEQNETAVSKQEEPGAAEDVAEGEDEGGAAVCVTETVAVPPETPRNTTTTTTAAAAAHDPIDQTFMRGPYGTQKQTVVLVQKSGRVRYFERTLYDQDVRPIPVGEGDRSFEFVVER